MASRKKKSYTFSYSFGLERFTRYWKRNWVFIVGCFAIITINWFCGAITELIDWRSGHYFANILGNVTLLMIVALDRRDIILHPDAGRGVDEDADKELKELNDRLTKNPDAPIIVEYTKQDIQIYEKKIEHLQIGLEEIIHRNRTKTKRGQKVCYYCNCDVTEAPPAPNDLECHYPFCPVVITYGGSGEIDMVLELMERRAS